MRFLRSATLTSSNFLNSQDSDEGKLRSLHAPLPPARRHVARRADRQGDVFSETRGRGYAGVFGLGECAVFRGLSADDVPAYEDKLRELCANISADKETDLHEFPSIRFGLETAINDFANGCRRQPFPSDFTEGMSAIPITGLVWMGTKEEMLRRIDDKIKAGFTTIKLKVGAIDTESELDLVRHIRKVFPPEVLTIRLDANGGFTPDNALQKLSDFARYGIHSIEQPIKQGQLEAMRRICSESPIDIALDEELIGIHTPERMGEMLDAVRPKYIILKPSLIGGFSGSQDWIMQATRRDIGGWVTSALESNVGLNAIAQWTAQLGARMPQGLGTGALFTNNIGSPLEQVGEVLRFNPAKTWQLPELDWRQ